MRQYEKVSELLRAQILSQQIQPGEHLPSLRSLSQQLSVSKNTVIRAYMTLEDEGLIEPRSRSGFIVRPHLSRFRDFPPPAPRNVRLGATALSVIGAASTPDAVPLGSAHPAAGFPAVTAFYKILARESYRKANSDQGNSHYCTPPGLEALRQQLTRRFQLNGDGIESDEIIITNGAMEAITLALLAVANAGDVIVVEKPAYYGNLNCIEALGMQVLEIPCDPITGMDLEILSEALSRWPVKAMLLNPSHNNPMGFSMPLDNRHKLLKLANQYDLAVIEDDTFGEIFFANQRVASLKSLDKEQRVICCSSFSKTLDSDIRLGWAAAGRYFEKLNYMKYVSSLASPGILQQAAAQFLSDNRYERHLRTIRKSYRQRSEQILAAIQQYWPREVLITPPVGGFLIWCELPQGCDGDRIYQNAKTENINITPGSLFSCDGSLRNCIRLNYSAWQNNDRFITAISRLGDLISDEIAQTEEGR